MVGMTATVPETAPDPSPPGYLTDELGFPAIPCTRCGGTGNIPRFGNVHHGVCFTCEGGKFTWPTPRVRQESAKARALLRAARDAGHTNEHGTYTPATGLVEAQPIDLSPGMIIRPQSWRRGPGGELIPSHEWRTVATVRRGTRISGGTLVVVGSGHADPDRTYDRQDWWVEAIITFTDGTRTRIGSENWDACPGPDTLAQVATLAAASRTGYERTLKRRETRATRT